MTMHAVSRRLGAGLLLTFAWSSASAQAQNAVLEWNEIARQTVAAENPLLQSRSMAMTQLAVLDAATAVGGGGKSLHATAIAPPASVEAAVMTAAHDTLLALYPDHAATLDGALAAGLATIVANESKAQGLALGHQAATELLERRKGDGWNAKVDYVPGGGPGRWVPTPPKFVPALGA
jgi:hypothetical protein